MRVLQLASKAVVGKGTGEGQRWMAAFAQDCQSWTDSLSGTGPDTSRLKLSFMAIRRMAMMWA